MLFQMVYRTQNWLDFYQSAISLKDGRKSVLLKHEPESELAKFFQLERFLATSLDWIEKVCSRIPRVRMQLNKSISVSRWPLVVTYLS